MSSLSFTPYPIARAMLAGENPQMLGTNPTWRPYEGDYRQEWFLETIWPIARKEAMAADDILAGISSFTAADVNTFLAQHGFSIQLTDTGDPRDFYLGSVLKLAAFWSIEGVVKNITRQNITYPGALMNQDTVQHFNSSLLANPLSAIRTKSKDVFYFSKMATPPTDEFQLWDLALNVLRSPEPTGDWGQLHFPMAWIDQQPNITWLLGMYTEPYDVLLGAYIREALQQTKIKLNEKGGSVESGVGLGMRFLSISPEPPPVLVIDEPYMLIVTRPGLTLPVTVAWVDTPDWKQPDELGKPLHQGSQTTRSI